MCILLIFILVLHPTPCFLHQLLNFTLSYPNSINSLRELYVGKNDFSCYTLNPFKALLLPDAECNFVWKIHVSIIDRSSLNLHIFAMITQLYMSRVVNVNKLSSIASILATFYRVLKSCQKYLSSYCLTAYSYLLSL